MGGGGGLEGTVGTGMGIDAGTVWLNSGSGLTTRTGVGVDSRPWATLGVGIVIDAETR